MDVDPASDSTTEPYTQISSLMVLHHITVLSYLRYLFENPDPTKDDEQVCKSTLQDAVSILAVLFDAALSVAVYASAALVWCFEIAKLHLLEEIDLTVLGRTLTAAYAFDNFDVKFPTSEPTVENPGAFVSATSATALPLFGVTSANRCALQCADELWRKDPRNPDPHANPLVNGSDAELLAEFHMADTDGRPASGESLSPREKRFSWYALEILLRYGAPASPEFKELLVEIAGGPVPVRLIPLHETKQAVFSAMPIKQSTADGNLQVLENLFRQSGIGEPESPLFSSGDVDFTGFVILAHGDLLTVERVYDGRSSRAIEATQLTRASHVIVSPGLFHFKMAASDVIWRIYLKPPSSRSDANSLMQHCGILRPNETGKFGQKVGFRAMHDLIQHDIRASMLDCFRQEIHAKHPGMTIEQFASTYPPLALWLRELANQVVKKYIARTGSLGVARDQQLQNRDERFENQTLRNRDEMMYLDLSHAMNIGDIGVVEASIPYWCYLFKATGKYKYCTQMLNFVQDLRTRYSPDLAEIIRMNWLVNPTGKSGRFRGVDWLVELNNLYTKVIHSGSSSNHTLDHIIKESNLIEFYRHSHVTIEHGFHLKHLTVRHAPPDMTRTTAKLLEKFRHTKPHRFTPGRGADYEIPDYVALAMSITQNLKKSRETERELEAEEEPDTPMVIESDDLIG
ncbi:hypothetical protein MKEN_01115300 [Mycena kentingensis (nom. inval.)]|nr:hypothetical protein MKEN_01115300 [Mycena kentingensis (nom. inval.)]